MDAAHDPQQLLAQTGWVRALALRLCRDPEQADDLAQDALTLALDRGPVGDEPLPVLRAWLARTLRLLAVQRPRSERRRKRRERSAAALHGMLGAERSVGSDPATLVARADLHQRVVQAVLGLDEPYRRTVLARFFDGEAHASIAAREGTSEAAIRQRVSRGIRTLRADLEREHGGSAGLHRALAVLVPGLRTLEGSPTAPGPWAWIGTLMAKRTVLTVTAGLLIAALTVTLAWQLTGPISDEEAPATSTRTATAASPLDAKSRDASSLRRAAEPVSEQTPAASSGTAPHADPRLGTLVVQTRRGDDSGAIDAGVLLELDAQQTDTRRHGARTDERGRAVFERLEPGLYTLRAGTWSVRSVLVAAGDPSSCELVLEAPATVRGRALDADRRPIAGVRVELHNDRGKQVGSAVTDAAGEFQIVGQRGNVAVLAEDATHRFEVDAPHRGAFAGYLSLLCPGETREVTLLRGPERRATPESGPVLAVRVRNQAGAPQADLWITATNASTGVSHAAATDASGIASLSGIDPGAWQLRIDSSLARGETLVEQLVTVDGATFEAPLEFEIPNPATIEGRVLDAEGMLVAGATVALLAETTGNREGRQVVLDTRSLGDGTYSLPHAWPGDTTLRATHPAHGTRDLDLHVTAGAKLHHDLAFEVATKIRGRLLDERGAVLVGWQVDGGNSARKTLTDTEGRFQLALSDADESVSLRFIQLDASLRRQPLTRLYVHGIEALPSEQSWTIPDATAATAWIHGTLLESSAGARPQSAHVHVLSGPEHLGIFPVSPRDGRFHAGPLPPGTHTLWFGNGQSDWPEFQPEPVTVEAFESVELDPIVVPHHGKLRVHVQLPAGADPAHLRLTLLDPDGSVAHNLRAEQDDPLAFAPYSPLEAGPYLVDIDHPDLAPAQHAVEVRPGAETTVHGHLRSALLQSVQLSSPDPLTDPTHVMVHLTRPDDCRFGQRRLRLLAADGLLWLRVPLPGRYRVEVQVLAAGPDRGARTGVLELEVGAVPSEPPPRLEVR